MKAKVSITVDGVVAHEETTNLSDVEEAIRCAQQKVTDLAAGHTADGNILLTVTAQVPFGATASDTLANLRKGGWRVKHWASLPKHIALDLERLRKRVER